jgi:hypothetical protein
LGFYDRAPNYEVCPRHGDSLGTATLCGGRSQASPNARRPHDAALNREEGFDRLAPGFGPSG